MPETVPELKIGTLEKTLAKVKAKTFFDAVADTLEEKQAKKLSDKLV